MLEGISKNIILAMPTVSTGCFVVAGAIAGKTVVSGVVCKTGAVVLDLFGNPKAAQWNKTSQDYFTQAKKEMFSDLTKAAGFALAGFGAKYAGEALKEIPVQPDSSLLDEWNFIRKVLGGGTLGTGLYLSYLFIKNIPELMGNN